jgi:hypothetical protein
MHCGEKITRESTGVKKHDPIVQLPAALSWKARRRHLHQRRKPLRLSCLSRDGEVYEHQRAAKHTEAATFCGVFPN